MTSLQDTVLWVACGGMGVGVFALAALSTRARPESRHHFFMSIAVCAIAFCAYYAMANGYGVIHLTHRREYYARYVDWTLTTPLLLGGLMAIALPSVSGARRWGIAGGVIGADVFMILVGLCGGLTENNPVKYGFYAISCIAFFVVFIALWGPIRHAAEAQGAATGELYRRLAGLLTVLWFVYPIIWLLGTEGVAVVSPTVEIIVIAATDLAAKVVFGLSLGSGILRLEAGMSAPARPGLVTADA